MIILHIGLAKTMSTKLFYYIKNHTDINVLAVNGNLESKMIDLFNFNYDSLSKTKHYYIKNPKLYNNIHLEKLVNLIKKKGHYVKIIFSVRNIIDNVNSLFNHWKKLGQEPKLTTPLHVYQHYFIHAYENIDNYMRYLKKYDTVVYYINNYKGTIKEFLLELFNLLEVNINIYESLPDEKIDITYPKDTTNLKDKIKNIDNLQKGFNKYFKDKTIFKL